MLVGEGGVSVFNQDHDSSHFFLWVPKQSH